jgi:hypothetical protein
LVRPKAKPRPHLLNLTLAGLPELDYFETDKQRQEALWSLGREAGSPARGSYWLAVAVLAAAVTGVRYLIKWLLAQVYWPAFVEEAVLWTVLVVTFLYVLRRLHRSGARAELRTKLLAQAVPVCIGCGYLLRGLPVSSGRCPECGRPFDDCVIEILGREPGA